MRIQGNTLIIEQSDDPPSAFVDFKNSGVMGTTSGQLYVRYSPGHYTSALIVDIDNCDVGVVYPETVTFDIGAKPVISNSVTGSNLLFVPKEKGIDGNTLTVYADSSGNPTNGGTWQSKYTEATVLKTPTASNPNNLELLGYVNDNIKVDTDFVNVTEPYPGAVTLAPGKRIYNAGGVIANINIKNNSTDYFNKAVFSRCHYQNWQWFYYQPMGDNYWMRTTYAYPNYSSSVAPLYDTIMESVIGRCYKGKVVNRDNITKSGSWTNAEISSLGLEIAFTSTQNDYFTVDVPEWTERIEILFYNSTSSGANTAISWGDDTTDDLEVTAYDTISEGTGLQIVTVANRFSKTSGRSIKVLHDDTSGTLRVCGVRFYSLSEFGNPAEADNGVSIGNDLIDTVDLANDSKPTRFGVDGYSYTIGYRSSTTDVAIEIADSGGTKNWLGGGSHLEETSGNYPYRYNSGEYTTGPLLTVDGVSKGAIYDIAANPLGTVYYGSDIQIYSDGYSDGPWTTNPDVIWQTNLYETGYRTKLIITANEIVELGQIHPVMLPYDETDSLQPTDVIDSELVVHNADSTFSEDGIRSFAVQYKDAGFVIGVTATYATNSSFWQDKGTYDKFYTLDKRTNTTLQAGESITIEGGISAKITGF